jgi:predicted transport protein
MARGQEAHPPLDSAFRDLRELKVDVAYPLLLELYQDYSIGALSAKELEQAVRLVESYVFRRVICNIPTNSLNMTFSTFGRALKKDRYLESILAQFLLLPSYRRFPDDEEFRREIKVRDLYNFRSRSYWLRRLENHDRKERVPVDEYTVEHILPQNEHLSQQWRDALGPEWKRVQETWLHTLGNLTLTGYNAEYSDRPFAEKRDMEGGFRESPLRVNEGLGTRDTWDEAAVRDRAGQLAQKAAVVWSAPTLPAEVLDNYRPKAVVKAGGYTIEDHPYLSKGSEMYGDLVARLFQALRKELLALDPCVTEEFLKLYVAYKAETNFVDVVPQAKQLRLSLNLQFHELYDPRGLAKDVTNLGRWGNGDVEVGLSKTEELPYVIGLVRHAFEKQMGNGEVDA